MRIIYLNQIYFVLQIIYDAIQRPGKIVIIINLEKVLNYWKPSGIRTPDCQVVLFACCFQCWNIILRKQLRRIPHFVSLHPLPL